MAGELIVGYDGTDGARAALATAAELAAQVGAGVVVAFAYEPPALGAEVADHRRLLEERGKALTDEALASLAGAGVEATAAVVGARPVEALLTLAAERQARMVVVGTGGEAPLMGVVLGATPYRLLHRSTVPVLVVPHPS